MSLPPRGGEVMAKPMSEPTPGGDFFMEIWTATRSLRVAAAFGTLGVPVRIERVLDERTGKANTTYYLGTTDVFKTLSTKTVKDRYESGELTREEPEHHLLDALAGMYNRDRILDVTERGDFIRLAKVRGANRSIYVDSDSGFPGIAGQRGVLRTGDLKLVAALGRVGVPVLAVEGQAGSRRYLLPTLWDCFGTMTDVGAFVKAFRDGAMKDVEHPFFYALGGLKARERLLDALREETELVMIRKPGSTRAAFIDPSANGKALDKMRTFFNR